MLIKALVSFLLVGILFSGCTLFANTASQTVHTSPTESTELLNTISTSLPTDTIATESTEKPEIPTRTQEGTIEPSPKKQGPFSIEDCKNRSGVFISYDDGSFGIIPSGGYCEGLSTWYDGFDGMYMPDILVEATPIVTKDMNLVLFWDSDYLLSLHPIHAEVSAFQTVSDDGTSGYGRMGQINTKYQSASIYLSYRNHESTYIDPVYINGKPAYEYPAEHFSWTVRPYSGVSQDYTYEMWNFVGDTITLGTGEGTTLIEKTYDIDAKYYDCYSDHNSCEEQDVHYLKGIPTPSGYATLDLSDVPSGRYAMVLEYNNQKNYKAFLLTLQ